jgi:hypothetical protein
MRKRGSWWSKKHRDYKYGDKQKGYEYSFTLDQALAIMQLPCYYCSKPESRGIDRLDNDKGHSAGNVVPCCEKCNIILGTLPNLAKLEMREALRQIHIKDLLKDWQPVYRIVPPKKTEITDEQDEGKGTVEEGSDVTEVGEILLRCIL